MHGLLFTSDFLREGIRDTRSWTGAETGFLAFGETIGRVFSDPSSNGTLDEAQTEAEVIVPVLRALGWSHTISQANTSHVGRHDVPDFLLFPSAKSKRAALAERSDHRRYRHGKLIVEARRWGRPLDRGDNADPLDPGTPSSQMLRYLSRAQVVSNDAVQWGILTNGAVWRLYWQNARSRSEEFLQFDLAELASVAGVNADLFAQVDAEKVHYLRAFFLLFRRQAFLPQPGDADGRSFHLIALKEGRQWESKVSQDLGRRVFDDLFPKLAAAIARNDPQAQRPLSREALDAFHDAALILLYRLLFLLYAEDRTLLPVNDPRYGDYSLRWQRKDIAERRERGDAFSTGATRIWQHLRGLFRAVDRGDDSIGLPPYNGGLFHEEPGDLLARIELRDAELAPLVDGLSRRPDLSGHGFINYRDLAVQHLGSIYERLLEQRLVETADGGLAVQPSTFARKNSGSYYTHDDLVKLILREALDPLQAERIAAFDTRLTELRSQRALWPAAQVPLRLAECDPAQALLALKVCDPAMGSGHFLVSLVDELADRVLEQIAHAEAEARSAGIPHYRSPVSREIERLRERILDRATQSRWAIDAGLLDDRHLVRRMILRRVVHGVDKNPMAVELAKLALWLHTFTVGAPLSFLDHHLRCGDSLHGERLVNVRADLNRLGGLFSDSHTAGLLLAAETMSQLNAINDLDLGEIERSRSLMDDAEATLEGLRRVFDLWQALRWIAPLDAPRRQRTDRHAAASELLSGRYGLTLMELLHGAGRVHSADPHVDARVNQLLDECRALARRERFLHWELAFPSIWPRGSAGGFDAVIGNPPWDRIKLQDIEWFAERRPQIALQARASDRRRLVAALQRRGDPLADEHA
ncbi:MAG: restriction endonuclease, partial [Lysobacter sp.]|nr:restriction endonuclease [Lysobacter sp.]